MLSVSVHKDIGEYTEKVVGKLSARTLACTAGGLASAVAAAAVANLALGIPVDATTLPVMAASMPFWLLGFWRPKGLPPREVPAPGGEPCAWRREDRLHHGLAPGVDSGPRRLR